jgi:predicted nucleic acid-binding protein
MPTVRKTRARRRATDDDLPAASSSLRYIESSALVAALLEQDAEALAALHEIGRRVTSALTFAEATRALLRARVTRRITPEAERAGLRDLRRLERGCTIVSVSHAILVRAGRPFPVEPVRTLDGVHLATIEALGEAPQLVTVVTRDARVARNARALGYAVASGE